MLEVRNLKKYYPVTSGLFQKVVGYVKAVDGVSFHINRGETLGLAGESGSGKSTLGRAILMLEKPTSGEIFYRGARIEKPDRNLRKEMQIIFQEPHSSLDPRMSVGDSIGEAFLIHNINGNVKELLKMVGLNPEYAERYPHELSGGEKQRVGIARALAVNPKLIIADEPVSALDVSTQAQILALLENLQEEFNLSYLFIAHNLAVMGRISQRIAVMYLGKIVEIGKTHQIFKNPLHPYTQALLSAIPVPNPHAERRRIFLKGDVFSHSAGCKFDQWCKKARGECSNPPEMKEIEEAHFVACHLY